MKVYVVMDENGGCDHIIDTVFLTEETANQYVERCTQLHSEYQTAYSIWTKLNLEWAKTHDGRYYRQEDRPKYPDCPHRMYVQECDVLEDLP